MPTFSASGSHHAPMPEDARPGARSSSVENVAARRAGLRVQQSTTPEPTLIRSVTAANAAIGTVASRTNRLSACHTASNPLASARCAIAIPSRIWCASCRYTATARSSVVSSFVRPPFCYSVLSLQNGQGTPDPASTVDQLDRVARRSPPARTDRDANTASSIAEDVETSRSDCVKRGRGRRRRGRDGCRRAGRTEHCWRAWLTAGEDPPSPFDERGVGVVGTSTTISTSSVRCTGSTIRAGAQVTGR